MNTDRQSAIRIKTDKEMISYPQEPGDKIIEIYDEHGTPLLQMKDLLLEMKGQQESNRSNRRIFYALSSLVAVTLIWLVSVVVYRTHPAQEGLFQVGDQTYHTAGPSSLWHGHRVYKLTPVAGVDK